MKAVGIVNLIADSQEEFDATVAALNNYPAITLMESNSNDLSLKVDLGPQGV